MKKIVFLSVLFFALALRSQQIPQSNVYSYNLFSINPAYSGATGCTEINFSHLNQWVKIEGAPLTSYLGINTRIGKNIGIGGQLLVDKIGMINQVSGMGALSYGFSFKRFHTLRFGLGVGYNQYRVNPSSAIAFDYQDPIINGGSQASGTLNSEFGMYYQWRNLELSVASKQLIQTYTNFGYLDLDGYGLKRHFNALASYLIKVNTSWAVKPSVFLKGINSGLQTDLNTDILYKNFVQAGLGYRTQVGLLARFAINIQDLFSIGYAYEAPMSNIASYSSGSHEIVLGLKFCRNKKSVPTYETQENVDDTNRREIVKNDFQVVRDTVFIEKIDTVFIREYQSISDEEVSKELLNVEKNLFFEKLKYNIEKSSFEELKTLVDILSLRPDIIIEIQGHTDNGGTDKENLELSKNRANEVKSFLVKNGVDDARIKISYFGESMPVSTNETESGRQMNRRVRIRVVKKDE